MVAFFFLSMSIVGTETCHSKVMFDFVFSHQSLDS